MASYYYQSSDTHTRSPRLFGRQRPVHAILGGGKVAEVLLWREPKTSAALLIGITMIWFLFEVAEYNFVTLLCHISITTMLIVFIWYSTAEIFGWIPPKLPEIILHEYAFKEAALTFHRRFIMCLSKLHEIACGRDIPLFFLALISLYILSVVGTYFKFLNLVYLGFVCMETLPFFYEKFEDDVDQFGCKIMREIKKSYGNFDSNFFNKIPRGPIKDKKVR